MYEEQNVDLGFDHDPIDQGQGQTVSNHIQMACGTLMIKLGIWCIININRKSYM